MKVIENFNWPGCEEALEFALPSDVLMSPHVESLLSASEMLPLNYMVAQNLNKRDSENLCALSAMDIEFESNFATPAYSALMHPALHSYLASSASI